MIEDKMFQYLRSIELERQKILDPKVYPYNLESIESLETLSLHPNVTFLIGENGTGKSTLLEAIAIAYGFNPEGGSKHFNFATRDSHSSLSKVLKVVKGVKLPKDGFFLRAESFYNVASNVEEMSEIDSGILASYGGKSLHKQSHGESFMSLILNRFRGNGLYILDEPEAALSPTRQFAMLSRIHELVEMDSQFIIATHSPILLAYPNAKIFDVGNSYEEIDYFDTEYYKLYSSFLENPKRMLDMLMSSDEGIE